MFEKYLLQNKAKVICIPEQGAKSTTLLVMYPVGSRYEPEKLSGVSHFIEHMMFKGTNKRKNTLSLTREIDKLGAEYNAFTGKEYTGYYIKADGKYFSKAADILSDMLFNSKFDSKEMEKEKQVIIEEIRMYNDNPLINIGNIFEELMYKGALGRDIAGQEKDVASFKRKDVLSYKTKHYQSNNIIIVAAGKINDSVKKDIEKYFDHNKTRKTDSSKRFKAYELGAGAKKDRLILKDKKTDQAQMMMGYPAFPYGDNNNAILSVLNTVLGASMSSRLFIQIRERRGLAYMVRSGNEKFRDTGYEYIRVGLETKNINKALSVIQSEIEKIVSQGVSKRELKDAKTHIRGSLALSLEDSSVQANWYAREALFKDKISTPEDKLKKIDAVTNEDIKKVAKKVFRPSELRVAVIGDADKESIIY
ncbi:MAG: hypothetical protein GF349_03755 [Candidatus Magasanikbacteria bacterium]|nr:hypothetical protein [Candidatus Magasanikbacteria bacterium]